MIAMYLLPPKTKFGTNIQNFVNFYSDVSDEYQNLGIVDIDVKETIQMIINPLSMSMN